MSCESIACNRTTDEPAEVMLRDMAKRKAMKADKAATLDVQKDAVEASRGKPQYDYLIKLLLIGDTGALTFL